VHFVMLEFAFILISVLPEYRSSSALLVVKPVAFVDALTSPIVLSLSVYLVIRKIALIIASIKVK
jgi:hypothetical protein